MLNNTLIHNWQTMPMQLRCADCRRYIYPGQLVWFEPKAGPGRWLTPYCYRCGSKLQDQQLEAVK